MQNGLISKIQRYSTQDGPGIRSTVFLVGCNLACKWCANPELIASEPQLLYHEERCKGCGTCASLNPISIRLVDGKCRIERPLLCDIDAIANCCPYGAYEIVGCRISSCDLANKLLRDKVFYENSGGGVTFSGGEACLQPEFVRETATLLRKESVHVALDTAGLVKWETLESILSEIDLVLFDLKAFDSSLHRALTGVSNELVLENAARISELGKPMFIRLIIVPGVNSSLEETRAKLAFVAALKSVRRVDILPYHKLGLGKYKRLGMAYTLSDVPECSAELSEQIKSEAVKLGLFAMTGG